MVRPKVALTEEWMDEWWMHELIKESKESGLDNRVSWKTRIEDRGSRIEDRGSRIEDRGSRIEDSEKSKIKNK